jgi:hypothetical protein
LPTHRTKTEAALAEAEAAHADDPKRAEALRRARAFKTSWVELAEVLVRVKRGNLWKEWGFESFDAYAKSELFLRQETVDKLTGSFTFLQRSAPAVLSRDGVREPIPSYQAVDFLRRAAASEHAPRDTIDAIRKRVIDDVAPASTVSRAYGNVVFPKDEAALQRQDVAGIRNVAKRLRELLTESRVVPRRLASEVNEALDRLLDAVEERGDDHAA